MNIDPTARIECDELVLGEGSIVRAHAEIYGRRVVIGREAFIDEYAVIGGGSAYSDAAEFVAGDWLHMGMFSQVNIARGARVGDEVGLGIGTRLFTHGAYLSEYDGFPVSFLPVSLGSRVWLPNAIVMPGVTIGDDVVVGAGSVVIGDLPSGCFAGGTPAKVIRAAAYPSVPLDRTDILKRICCEAGLASSWYVIGDHLICRIGGFGDFDVRARTISGPVTADSEKLREQLRRHGIRFRYEPRGGVYEPWL